MTTSILDDLPVAVIGGGPVGLAAAAHLTSRGQRVRLYEAGARVGANVRDWGHVRVFTPWRYCVDAAATALLARQGWRLPPADAFPTGDDIVASYLEPLAATPDLSSVIETGARVTAISRLGLDKVVTRGREERPFVLSIATSAGVRRDLARAVLDASGTWSMPNPLGANGLPADNEAQFAERPPSLWGAGHARHRCGVFGRQCTARSGAPRESRAFDELSLGHAWQESHPHLRRRKR
jgi:cation diffusion facilitator CzcD-associated flavoprotein CzcO